MYEYQAMQGQQILLNTSIGLFAAYKAYPFQQAAAGTYSLFRKAWMRVPIQAGAFGAAYYVANQLQTRIFPRFHFNYWREGGQKNELYFGNQSLISKFRFFDSDDVASADAKAEIEDYLDYFTSGPLTKADMLQRIQDGRGFDERFAKHFRIGRWGKDQNEIFWKIGKIHGLENIAYLTD